MTLHDEPPESIKAFRSGAAAQLGATFRALRGKLKKLGID